jgi:acyl carrier protein
VEDAIRKETDFDDLIEDEMSAQDIEGWDSLAHVRIVFRVDLGLGTKTDLNKTYATGTIGELIEVFIEELGGSVS